MNALMTRPALTARKDGIDPYPEVLLRGAIFLSIIQSINFYDFEDIVDEWLVESKIGKIDPAAWYPRQEWLNLLKKLERFSNTTENQISIGMKVIENAELPPDLVVANVTDAINVLVMVYVNEQKNLPEGDNGYAVRKIDDKHYEVVDNNPYLFHVNYGYIWGILRRFLKSGFTLTYKYLNEQNPEMGGILFKIALD